MTNYEYYKDEITDFVSGKSDKESFIESTAYNGSSEWFEEPAAIQLSESEYNMLKEYLSAGYQWVTKGKDGLTYYALNPNSTKYISRILSKELSYEVSWRYHFIFMKESKEPLLIKEVVNNCVILSKEKVNRVVGKLVRLDRESRKQSKEEE